MIYECEKCLRELSAGLTVCPGCGDKFDSPVPADAETPSIPTAALRSNLFSRIMTALTAMVAVLIISMAVICLQIIHTRDAVSGALAPGAKDLPAEPQIRSDDAASPLIALWSTGQNSNVSVNQAIAALRAGASVNTADKHGVTALMWAVSANDPACVQTLIEHGANVNAKTQNGVTALEMAAIYGNARCCALLLAHGADPNIRANDGNTPLMVAAYCGHSECVQQLLRAAGGVNATNLRGQTALMLAASGGDLGCVKALLSARANVKSRTLGGDTALQYASQGYGGQAYPEIIAALKAAGEKQ